MSKKRILVVEDESDISEILCFNLEREGFEVVTACDGVEALEKVREERFSLVLLDLLLPGIDGLEVCRTLRSHQPTSDLPIIMLTAKGEESDIVLGLGLGADDYILKPFSPREVVARIKAVLRRKESPAVTQDPLGKIECGPLSIDPASYRVYVDGQQVQLTPTEFRLLRFLAASPERVYTRNQLINRVIGDGAVVIDRNIDVHIRSVRKKLDKHRGMIETIRGIGYAFRLRPE